LPSPSDPSGVILEEDGLASKITVQADARGSGRAYVHVMATWSARTTVMGSPEDVIGVLTDPTAARRWSPVGFELEDLDGDRLEAGSRARLVGRLAGRGVSFDVDVFDAGDGLLSLRATGPVEMDVRYDALPHGDGAEVVAYVDVRSRGGLLGRVLSSATDALLAGGALEVAVSAVAREVEGSSQLAAAA
jgi:hypothetical protein